MSVLRFSGDHAWPSSEQVHLHLLPGIVNTILLTLSGLTIWRSTRLCSIGDSSGARTWLLATLLLGFAFLGVKSYEYSSKYEHGIFPGAGRSLIYGQADDNYLSRVVLEMRREIRRLEQTPEDGRIEEKQTRLEELYLLQSGIVDWTQFAVGRSGDNALKREAIQALAHQIYLQHESAPGNEFIEAERKRIGQESEQLRQRIELINRERTVAQDELRVLLPRKDSGDEVISQQYERVAETVSRLTDDMGALSKELRPVQDRLAAVDMVESSEAGEGINERYGIRLPIVIPGGHKWASLYYLLTGTHAIHLIFGLIVMMFLLLFRLDVSWLPTLENLNLYWHFVDVVWILIFAVIYLT